MFHTDLSPRTSLQLCSKFMEILRRDYSDFCAKPGFDVFHPFMANSVSKEAIAPGKLQDLLSDTGPKFINDVRSDPLWLSAFDLDAMSSCADIAEKDTYFKSFQLALNLIEMLSPAHREEAELLLIAPRIVSRISHLEIVKRESTYKSLRGAAEYTTIVPSGLEFISATDSDYFGAPFFSESVRSSFKIALQIVHECGHHLLHAVISSGDVFIDHGNQVAFSPARKCNRLLEDSLHGIVAVEREVYLLKLAMKNLESKRPSSILLPYKDSIYEYYPSVAVDFAKSLQSFSTKSLNDIGLSLLNSIKNEYKVDC